jgi:cell division protein FtsB
VRNKFTLTFLGFMLYMLLLDSHGIIRRVQQVHELKEARAQVRYYHEEIAQTEKELQLLFSSDESIERFARERFFLKRDNEEVFLIEED